MRETGNGINRAGTPSAAAVRRSSSGVENILAVADKVGHAGSRWMSSAYSQGIDQIADIDQAAFV